MICTNETIRFSSVRLCYISHDGSVCMVIIYANKKNDGKCYTINIAYSIHGSYGFSYKLFQEHVGKWGRFKGYSTHRPRPQVIPGFRFEALKKAMVRPSSSSRASPSSVSPAEFRPSGEAIFRRGEWEKWVQVMAFFVMKMDIVWTNNENYMGLWKKNYGKILETCASYNAQY